MSLGELRRTSWDGALKYRVRKDGLESTKEKGRSSQREEGRKAASVWGVRSNHKWLEDGCRTR